MTEQRQGIIVLENNEEKFLPVEMAKPVRSIQDRVEHPEKLVGGAMLLSQIDWLAEAQDDCPDWGCPLTRAQYLEYVIRRDTRLAGVVFTMVSRMVSTGFSLSGPIDDLEMWYDVFAFAEGGDWSLFIPLIFQDYLLTDEGAIFETGREYYPDGPVRKLWAVDSKQCIPGPVQLDQKVVPLLFQDVDKWKAFKEGEFYRFASMPSTDQYGRRMGFCFGSRVLRAARLAWAEHLYKEERMDNLPPVGVATITGLTKAQVESAMNEYELQKIQKRTLKFPGILWFIANQYGQEAKVDFTSFREAWEGYNEGVAAENFMKTVALAAGMDVWEIWQPEVHGATKAASWLQHKKAMGKGSVEFIVAFERWATRILPLNYRFLFDQPDDEQDKLAEEIRGMKIQNLKLLWEPDASGERLFTADEVKEMMGEEGIVPQRFVNPPERVVTDIQRSTGKTCGIMRWPDGGIDVVRRSWMLDSTIFNGRTREKPLSLQQAIKSLEFAVIPQAIQKQWGLLFSLFSAIFDEWKTDVKKRLEDNPDSLDRAAYWQDWAGYIEQTVAENFIESVMEGAMSTGLPISFDKINEQVREIAGEEAFDMVQLDGPESIIRVTRDKLDEIREDLASGALKWVDLEERLMPVFGPSRAKMIAISENTNLWAKGQMLSAHEAGMTEKMNVRADIGRPCPSNVCNDNSAVGWIPIDEPFPSGGQNPGWHPSCYCYLRVR